MFPTDNADVCNAPLRALVCRLVYQRIDLDELKMCVLKVLCMYSFLTFKLVFFVFVFRKHSNTVHIYAEFEGGGLICFIPAVSRCAVCSDEPGCAIFVIHLALVDP